VDLSVVVGKTIAFPGETSTSGYIFPTIQLINAGSPMTSTRLFFGGSHDLAVTAVYNGDAQIGLSFDDARRSIREDYPMSVRRSSCSTSRRGSPTT
jgi:phosphonate transport system substrate-binding protein